MDMCPLIQVVTLQRFTIGLLHCIKLICIALRRLPTFDPICPTSLQCRHINADRAFFSTWRQYLTSVEYLELGFDNVTVAMATRRSNKTGFI